MFIHGNYYSDVLRGNRHFTAQFPENIDNNIRVVVLLHGVGSDDLVWSTHAPLGEWVESYQVAFLCPEANNSFYTDQQCGDAYGEAIGREFIESMQKIFQLPRARAQIAIAGFSMGGYGAIRLGLKYSTIYDSIGAFSPAFVFYKKAKDSLDREPNFDQVFSKGLFGSENDCFTLYKKAQLPIRIRLTCGNKDPLDLYTQEFYDQIRTFDKEADVHYVQQDGFHDFSLWRPALKEFLMEWTNGGND